MRIRRARPEDAKGIAEVHRRAVQEFGASHYDDEILEAWSPPVDEARIESTAESLGDDTGSREYVAIQEGRIVGFAAAEPGDGVIRGVYVDPDYARRGLGASLLRQVEWSAAQAGSDHLELESSLNAADFYREQGWEEEGRGTFDLGEGLEMACVEMKKELPGPGL